MIRRGTALLIGWLACLHVLQAQEVWRHRNQALIQDSATSFFYFSKNNDSEFLKEKRNENQAHKQATGEPRTLTLPFFEDFNLGHSGPLDDARRFVPDTLRWFSNRGVQLNRSSAIDPPDFGVAVFDGAADDGRGWLLLPIAVTDGADTLTSHAFDLRSYALADSLRLSFWYQGGGRMERPDTVDSLILEFRDSVGDFRRVWASAEVDTSRFRYASIPLEDSLFLHRRFQFRLRNIATRNGPFDQWFVDHIWLAAGRSAGDSLPVDRAVVGLKRGLLWPYTALPRRVLNGLMYNKDSIVVELRSTDSLEQNSRLHVMLSDPTGGVGLIDVRRDSVVLPPLADQQKAVRFDDPTRWTYAQNSMLRHTAYLDSSERDRYRRNDTLRLDFRADTLYALDDGEAESWYGVTNPGAPFAQMFYCEQPERLQAVWLTFVPRETVYDTALTFNLGIWSFRVDTIRKVGVFLRDSIFLDTIITPVYLSGIEDTVRYGPVPNFFRRYAFDAAAVADGLTTVQGYFLVGLIQRQGIPIGVGYDLNANSAQRIVFQVRPQVWAATAGTGTLMIRPEVANAYPRREPPARTTSGGLRIYPNPVRGSRLSLDQSTGEALNGVRWQLLDITGRTVGDGTAPRWTWPQTLDLGTAPPAGVYVLRVQGTTDSGFYNAWTTRLLFVD